MSRTPRLRHYSVTWTSPYLPNRRPQTLTMRSTSKKEALKAHDKLFAVAKRNIKVIP